MNKHKDKNHKCDWCENKATKTDFRSIDGVVSKFLCCDICFILPTKKLLEKIK